MSHHTWAVFRVYIHFLKRKFQRKRAECRLKFREDSDGSFCVAHMGSVQGPYISKKGNYTYGGHRICFKMKLINIYIQIMNSIQTLRIDMSHMRSHDQFPKKARVTKYVALYHSFPNVLELCFKDHFSLRYKVKHVQFCKKRPIFSVFCVFLNEE